ncbi:MAG: hypothetical protein Q9175_008005 [Cornicularia normoerica]
MVSLSPAHSHLNNTSAARSPTSIEADKEYPYRSLAISDKDDDPEIRSTYRPFLLDKKTNVGDWVEDVELATVTKIAAEDIARTGERLKVLVLFGSLRQRLGCDVRVYDPTGLPVKDDIQHQHPKVQELRDLSRWSNGHVWVSPEQHGNLTAVFKNQIDWIPLSTGSVRPTQGRTLAIAQVSGGSQSFNTVNSLRILGRWMRMFTIPNQSSIPKAYTQFTQEEGADEGDRLTSSGNRDRLVDCMEEFVKYTIIMRPHFTLFGDRFSEREERRAKERSAEEREGTLGKEQVKVDGTGEKEEVNAVQIGSI